MFNLASRILPGPGIGRCHLPSGAAKVLDSSLYHLMDEYKQAPPPKFLGLGNGFFTCSPAALILG